MDKTLVESLHSTVPYIYSVFECCCNNKLQSLCLLLQKVCHLLLLQKQSMQMPLKRRFWAWRHLQKRSDSGNILRKYSLCYVKSAIVDFSASLHLTTGEARVRIYQLADFLQTKKLQISWQRVLIDFLRLPVCLHICKIHPNTHG
jgi:hypothetical protein